MYLGLHQPLFYFMTLWFGISVAVSWLIPGLVILKNLRLKPQAWWLLLAVPIGMAVWGIQGYVFGYLGWRWLSYAYLTIFGLVWVKDWKSNYHQVFSQALVTLKSQPLWFWLVIAISTGFQLFAHLRSGLTDQEGLKIYFVNAVDGVMHLGYIESLKNSFPPVEPGAVGYPLINYHYWSDLILAELSRIWGLPAMHLFFQWVPVLLTVWTLLMVSQLIHKLGGTRKTILIAFFLLTFGGDAAYIFTQLLHGTWGEKVSSLDSGVTFIFNFPQMVARTTFIAAWLLLLEWWQRKKLGLGIVASILIATLFGFKVYYGLYSVIGLGAVFSIGALTSFIATLRKQGLQKSLLKTIREQLQPMLMVIVLAIVALSIYLPVNKGAGGLTYSPLEWPRLLLSADNIDFRDWALRMQVYEAYGNTRNILIFNGLAVAMTFVAVYGTRMLGFLPLTFSFSGLGQKVWSFFVPANLIFILLGLFTLQTSGGLNVFNFLIVPILSFNIFSAFTLSKLPTKILLPIFVVFALLTVPRSFFQLQHFYTRYQVQNPDLHLSYDQLAALDFIKTQTPDDAIVQTPPSNSHDQLTPYVAYFTHRQSYMTGISMLESHNQPTKERQTLLKAAFDLSTFSDKRDALQNLGINYLFFSPTEYQRSGFIQDDVIFENEAAVVVKLP